MHLIDIRECFERVIRWRRLALGEYGIKRCCSAHLRAGLQSANFQLAPRFFALNRGGVEPLLLPTIRWHDLIFGFWLK